MHLARKYDMFDNYEFVGLQTSNLFKYAIELGYDLNNFVDVYMTSVLRSGIDKNDKKFSGMDYMKQFEYLKNNNLLDGIKKAKNKIDSSIGEGIGMMYTYLQDSGNKTSKEIIKIVPFTSLMQIYKKFENMWNIKAE